MNLEQVISSAKKYFLLKALPMTLIVGLGVAGCSTTKPKKETIEDYLKQPQKTEQVIEEEAQKTEEIPEIRYDINNPEDLNKIFSEENRYHWTRDAIMEGTVSWYNHSILTMWTGFKNNDMVVVLHNEDGSHIVAERAKINFYPELKAATIAYKVKGKWYETTPSDPEGNIDLNNGDKGGIYLLTNKYFVWPEDPFKVLLANWYGSK